MGGEEEEGEEEAFTEHRHSRMGVRRLPFDQQQRHHWRQTSGSICPLQGFQPEGRCYGWHRAFLAQLHLQRLRASRNGRGTHWDYIIIRIPRLAFHVQTDTREGCSGYVGFRVQRCGERHRYPSNRAVCHKALHVDPVGFKKKIRLNRKNRDRERRSFHSDIPFHVTGGYL